MKVLKMFLLSLSITLLISGSGSAKETIETCNFDEDGQKDLIYTFSWGSGMHRSHIGVYNFSKDQEAWIDFVQMNKDIMLIKVSDNSFEIYNDKVSSENLDFCHPKLSKQEQVADVKNIDGKIGVERYKE